MSSEKKYHSFEVIYLVALLEALFWSPPTREGIHVISFSSQLLHCTEIHLNTFNKDLCSFLKVIFYRCEQHVKGIIVNIIQSNNCTNTASNDFYKPTSTSHSHFCQTSRRSHPWCNDTIPQHRQCCQAEDLHSHCD